MSPFWKNVNEELQYQGMNIKTLSALTGIPYTTITNGRNRPDSIPTADVALKISKVLNKSLEWLLGESVLLPKSNETDVSSNEENVLQKLNLYHKYERLITSLENRSVRTQTAFINLATAISEE
ncbi:MAG: helix-turn-helix transcriptional regulator [Treponema sp.]|uniref:helix-turn-helix domain-containing protein n=1 Tax=Treponema sp. TaxID=166 RepID=UPI0025DF6903|nr:helix-turn-helix transcriptional regulator [Treponema sp.]MBR0495341.1 helix-turn-helix transcriptional regulator [Treponema sp.]